MYKDRDPKSSDISNNSSSFEDKKSSLKTESSKIEKGKSLYSIVSILNIPIKKKIFFI